MLHQRNLLRNWISIVLVLSYANLALAGLKKGRKTIDFDKVTKQEKSSKLFFLNHLVNKARLSP